MLTAEQARDVLARRVADAQSTGSRPDFSYPGQIAGRAAENLTGRKLGDFQVVGYLCSSGVTPWWVVRCRACKTLAPRRGSAIRNLPNTGRCEACLDKRRAWRRSRRASR